MAGFSAEVDPRQDPEATLRDPAYDPGMDGLIFHLTIAEGLVTYSRLS